MKIAYEKAKVATKSVVLGWPESTADRGEPAHAQARVVAS